MSICDFIFQDGGAELLDRIAPQWEKLRDHHRAVCRDFAEEIAETSFACRKAELAGKAAPGHLRVDLAKDNEGAVVGYCVASVNSQKVGEVDSIFVEPLFRNQGLGDTLMRRALEWMDEHQVRAKTLAIAAGNERAGSLYRRHGFLPRSITWKQAKR